MTSSGITITEVRVRNYRALRNVDIRLNEFTLLIGENNSGKTSCLDALHAAIGAGRRVIAPEDIFLAPEESVIPKDREIVIDVLIRPIDGQGSIMDSFPEGSPWLELWGNGVSQDDDDNDFVGVRTQYKWDTEKGEYVTERRFLLEWKLELDATEASSVKHDAGPVYSAHLEPIALYLLDAKRDIQDELLSKGSFWHKLVSDPGLEETQIKSLEEALSKLNNEIISNSTVLRHLQDHLDELYHTVASERGSVSITPLTRHLRDLSKGVSVNFSTRGAQTFPLERHGMGTRSLAAILVFKAYTSWRQSLLGADGIHSVLALEEPESHLHPQAQRALFRQIKDMPGQRIVSTHSPYIVSQADISHFRHFGKVGAEAVVNQIDTSALSKEHVRKINQAVMRTRGDLLYARALVLFEGDTEEYSLPIFAEEFWQRNSDDLGISLIPVGGMRNYTPFLILAENFGIRWYVFSDGEDDAIRALESALKGIGVEPINQPNVFVLPDGHNYESYLVEEYPKEIVRMLDDFHEQENYICSWIARRHGQKRKKEGMRDYKSEGGLKRALNDMLTENKTLYAAPLARTIATLPDADQSIPLEVRKVLEAVSRDLDLVRPETTGVEGVAG